MTEHPPMLRLPTPVQKNKLVSCRVLRGNENTIPSTKSWWLAAIRFLSFLAFSCFVVVSISPTTSYSFLVGDPKAGSPEMWKCRALCSETDGNLGARFLPQFTANLKGTPPFSGAPLKTPPKSDHPMNSWQGLAAHRSCLEQLKGSLRTVGPRIRSTRDRPTDSARNFGRPGQWQPCPISSWGGKETFSSLLELDFGHFLGILFSTTLCTFLLANPLRE